VAVVNPSMSNAAPAVTDPSSDVLPCWSCKGPRQATDLFCPTCQAVQPPGQLDHFSRFDLAFAYDLDVDALERRYFDLQRVLHPDRFATRSAQEKSLSQQQAVSLNDAFEVLKNPLERANYLLTLKGADGINHDHTVHDPMLLMEAMETREALSLANDVAGVNVIVDKTRKDQRACINAISAAFKQDDLAEVTKLAYRLKYLTKLLDETRQHKARLVMK